MKKCLTYTAMLASMFTPMFARFAAHAASSPNSLGPKAHANLINAQGKPVGSAELTQLVKGVEIKVDLRELPAGAHGFHIHGKGACDAPEFKSAGEHFNPQNTQHGLTRTHPHAGDMVNLVVKADGTAQLTLVNEHVSLGKGRNSLLEGQGTALIVHADADDQQTPPSGASGARIACGVIKAD